MKEVIEKYTDKVVHGETTLRSKIPGLFLDRQKEIKEESDAAPYMVKAGKLIWRYIRRWYMSPA